MTFWYRFEDRLYSESRVMLVKSEFKVLSETETGVWIDYYSLRKKFVKKDARKRFACPTEAEALASYYARKRRQVSILTHKLKLAEAALQLTPDNTCILAVY